MMKRISILMMSLLVMVPAEASDFVQNEVHYRTLTDSTVVVTNYESSDKDGSDVYIPMGSPERRAMVATSGYEVEIPMKVSDGGKSYTVTAIGDNAFLNLDRMSAITLPASIEKIGKSAFAGCSGLTSISCPTSAAPKAFANSFTSVSKSACTLYVKLHTRSQYASATGWADFANIVELGYKVTYKVDGEVYATDSLSAGEVIVPIAEPTKEGYTFSGWKDCPEVMPAHDVEVMGSFSINSYILTYKVDGEVYKTSSVRYGTTITAEAEPTRVGYTFSGWSEIPESMPAHDVEVTGTFTINTYKVELTIGKGGTATISNETPEYGSSVVLTITPDTGYELASVMVNDNDVTAQIGNGSYTIEAIKADVKISVSFSAVSGIETISSEKDNATWYDLSGRKVHNLRQGELLIRNGKKLIIR